MLYMNISFWPFQMSEQWSCDLVIAQQVFQVGGRAGFCWYRFNLRWAVVAQESILELMLWVSCHQHSCNSFLPWKHTLVEVVHQEAENLQQWQKSLSPSLRACTATKQLISIWGRSPFPRRYLSPSHKCDQVHRQESPVLCVVMMALLGCWQFFFFNTDELFACYSVPALNDH